MSRNTPEKFWGKIERRGPDECWEWQGPLNTHGYGDAYYQGTRTNAHRIAYQLANGDKAAGQVICHKCDNRKCCNPGHLWAGTQRENVQDCNAKGRAKGVFTPGELHPRHLAKLTPDMIEEARTLYASGVSQSEIGRRWGVHPSAISRAVRGITFPHV